uniref:F-box protein SKIP22-like n=1 Tax=Populus alba TaxID=43335 RepID=A0A4U5NQW7_POPAL|nr:F-box protein SKIP22-like [Populus alba]
MESLILNFKDMPKEQGTLAQVLSVQEQVIDREESETSHQELPLNFPNQQTTSRHESSVSAGFEGVAEPSSSEPTTEKDEDCSSSNHNAAIATHAILLEFGLLLPENVDVAESIYVKVQCSEDIVNVCGSLTKGGSDIHRVCLNGKGFGRTINLLRANCERNSLMNDNDKNEVRQLEKVLKDGLALPLLIDLCEKTGMAPPPCFDRLPRELKLKIMDLLSLVDVGRMECVCSELRFLSRATRLIYHRFRQDMMPPPEKYEDQKAKIQLFMRIIEVRNMMKKAMSNTSMEQEK